MSSQYLERNFSRQWEMMNTTEWNCRSACSERELAYEPNETRSVALQTEALKIASRQIGGDAQTAVWWCLICQDDCQNWMYRKDCFCDRKRETKYYVTFRKTYCCSVYVIMTVIYSVFADLNEDRCQCRMTWRRQVRRRFLKSRPTKLQLYYYYYYWIAVLVVSRKNREIVDSWRYIFLLR